jgi:uncharacterized protein YcbX
MTVVGKVESLWRYPVKSMRGEEISLARAAEWLQRPNATHGKRGK